MPQSRRRTAKRSKRPPKSASSSEHKSNQTAKLVVSAGVAILCLGLLVYLIFMLYQSGRQPSEPSQAASGLKIIDQVVGTGPGAQRGQTVRVHYTGKLEDGTKFDSSLDRGEPYDFVIGKSSVIDGWHQGLLDMKVGGKRQLIIPPELGYGATGRPPKIPPNATLVFDIELLGLK